ncbi:Zinc finger protein zfs1 [Cucumispora dikerogammari]|nr:Zinc finger protein zfs1 [Cucumispora dikerogammari]
MTIPTNKFIKTKKTSKSTSNNSVDISFNTIKPANSNKKLNKADLYKTEMCKSFLKYSFCKYGQKCQFAHEKTELRNVLRHPRYKTVVCSTYSLYGDCTYTTRCCFLHEEANIQTRDEVPSTEDIVIIENKNNKENKITFKNDVTESQPTNNILKGINDRQLKSIYAIDLVGSRGQILKTKIKYMSENSTFNNTIGYPEKPKFDQKHTNMLSKYLQENT